MSRWCPLWVCACWVWSLCQTSSTMYCAICFWPMICTRYVPGIWYIELFSRVVSFVAFRACTYFERKYDNLHVTSRTALAGGRLCFFSYTPSLRLQYRIFARLRLHKNTYICIKLLAPCLTSILYRTIANILCIPKPATGGLPGRRRSPLYTSIVSAETYPVPGMKQCTW